MRKIIVIIAGWVWACTALAGWMTAPKTEKEVNKQDFYTITYAYPEVSGIPDAATINQAIHQKIQKSIAAFKKNLDSKTEMMGIHSRSGLPALSENSNVLDIKYDKEYQSKNRYSIRFSEYSFLFGSAHPNTGWAVFNYDIQQHKVLTLAEVFKPDTDYLNFLSAYCRKALQKKWAKEKPILDEEGLKPTAENFAIWNLTPKGLLISFQPYQVLPHVFGPQEVLIPNSALESYLKKEI